MLSTLRGKGRRSSSKSESTQCEAWGPPPKLRKLKKKRTVKSILASTLCGSSCQADVPSSIGKERLPPRPKTRRPNFKKATSSISVDSMFPDVPPPDSDGLSSILASESSYDSLDDQPKKPKSALKKLIKLVSPIKGLPSILSNRKVSKRNGGSKKASKTKSRSNKKGAPPTCERSELDDVSVIELEENATLGNMTNATPALAQGSQEEEQRDEIGTVAAEENSNNASAVGAPTKGSDKLQEPTVTLPGMVAGGTGEGSTDTESIAPENPACELPSSTVEAEVKPTKQRIAPFRMKVIRDLRRVQESNEKEEEELPHILTIKEWVKLEKKREKEAKKAMKKESQLVKSQADKPARPKSRSSKKPAKGTNGGEVNDISIIELEDILNQGPDVAEQQSNSDHATANQEATKVSGEGSEKDTGTTECSTDPAPASTTSTTAESEGGKTCIEAKCKSPEIPDSVHITDGTDSLPRPATSAGDKADMSQGLAKHTTKPRTRMFRTMIRELQESTMAEENNEAKIVTKNVQIGPKNKTDVSTEEESKESKVETKVIPRRPLGAHHNRRRSVRENVQEQSPTDYKMGRQNPEKEEELSSDEEEEPVFNRCVVAWCDDYLAL